MGQFFTPRQIVEFMVDMVEPKRNHFILDPAVGSGGFLIFCMERVFDEIESLYRIRGLDNPKQEKRRFAINKLFGIDLNQRMTWVAKMNMVMHGDGHGGIFTYDGLRDSERIEPIIDVVNNRGGFDVILTNPPFGSKIKNQDVLTKFKLGRKKKTQLTEVLFIERCLKLLKSKGILGIVVPDSVLSNTSLHYVREFIDENAIWRAIISLPQETFMPYGSGVKASLLFLQKKDIGGQLKQEKIFKSTLDEVRQTKKRNVFISFSTDDETQVNLLRHQAKDNQFGIEFRDYSIKEPFNEKWKTNCKIRIEQTSALICMIGENTAQREAVIWEINEAYRQGKKVIGVRKHRDKDHPIPKPLLENNAPIVNWDLAAISKLLEDP